jgi:hypothetical protein
MTDADAPDPKGRKLVPEENDHEHDHGHVHGPGCAHGHAPQAPVVRATPKVGRNDPCPCGSGAKFKKCCGAT